ncbi:breast cancer type 1 susceptibility protein isoform X4 [Gopherus evgoodei]|uniref:breast cancer type 1 susceptibility protein isoform X4 n=1 Tax=Gopherus evgoodei TaxID=1825980 RepID=UPI0011CF0C1C|nr:breast cancer type 1 susceptibility protein isoform X4 [Gopherus evgoodei]
MESSVAAIGDVQSVLLAMQKNLECPICLELIKEPVSTKCDHIFCRFCMFKLLSKKKKGPAQCPLCKTEITKRSLQENPRFKQLIEGLLETIHAFELDTGIKFLNSQDFSKKPVETSSTELLWREGSIIQSKGYRNRQKRIQEQENPTLEANADAQVADNMVRRSSLRNKRQKCESGKAVYIEFGSDSSDDLFEKAGGGGMGDKELFQTPPQKGECEEELKYAEKESESPYNMWPLKSDAGEILSSDILGEASGYDSEASHPGDSSGLSSQCEILTTQQKDAMQNNLKKLQQEMAVLEAVLEEHGSQGFEFQPRASELPHSRVEGTLTVGQMRPARGTALISEVDLENHKISSSKGLSADGFHVMPSDHSNTKNKELEKEGSRSPALHLSHPKSHLFKKEALEQGHWCPSLWKAKTHSKEGTVQQVDVAVLLEQEGVKQCNQYRIEPENAAEQEFGTRINSAAVLCGNERRTPNSSPLKFSERLTHFQTAESTNSVAVSWNVVNGKSTQGCKQERRAFSSASALHAGIVKENAKSPVTCRRQMSVVASGLNQSELLLVQKFARKTQSTLSNQITEGTTHVIMKTDMELVCERTLKYFLGIAGRKWVVSYEWIVQSFKEGRILDEYNFEVRGDVINGRNHEGPKRARRSQARKLFKDFEICCYGPFTDMRTGDLEWMVELCGASVVKQPHLFTHKANSIAVIVVQPDAWLENAGYRAIQQKCTAMVTREWVLDSVACYECQEFDTYLVSQS